MNYRLGVLEIAKGFFDNYPSNIVFQAIIRPIGPLEIKEDTVVWVCESDLFDVGTNRYDVMFTRQEDDSITHKIIKL